MFALHSVSRALLPLLVLLGGCVSLDSGSDDERLPTQLAGKAEVLATTDADYPRAVITSAVKAAGEGGVVEGGALYSAEERASVGLLGRVVEALAHAPPPVDLRRRLREHRAVSSARAFLAVTRAASDRGDCGSRVWPSGFSECHGSGCNFKRLGRAFARPRAASPFS